MSDLLLVDGRESSEDELLASLGFLWWFMVSTSDS
jgi:hypothetical protein